MRFKRLLALMAALCLLFVSYIFAAMPAGYKGVVFDSLKGIPQQIPGLIATPYFDKGGLDTTFHYAGGNAGDCFWRNGDPGKIVSLQFFGDYKDFVSRADVRLVDSACYPVGANAHLGWIQNGEWLNYTVHVNTAGNYKMIFHESDVDANNLIVVTFSGLPPDSVKNMPVSLRPPGDHEAYHDWKWDTTATRLALDTGLYVMKLAFFQGAWNFHAIKFLLDATSTVATTEQGLTQKGFGLLPVVTGNNMTVSYSLRQAGPATVSVFDCAGRAMVPAVVRNLNAGSQKQSISLGTIGRGVYFVRVEQNGLCETTSFTLTR
jgi:hypothetical protein